MTAAAGRLHHGMRLVSFTISSTVPAQQRQVKSVGGWGAWKGCTLSTNWGHDGTTKSTPCRCGSRPAKQDAGTEVVNVREGFMSHLV